MHTPEKSLQSRVDRDEGKVQFHLQQSILKMSSPSSKNVSDIASERIIKIRLALMRYRLKIHYLPGKQMFIADLLSRNLKVDKSESEIEISGFIHNIYKEEELLDYNIIKNELILDKDLNAVMNYCVEGWPNKADLPKNDVIRHYFKLQSNIQLADGLLYYCDRLVIPSKISTIEIIEISSHKCNGEFFSFLE